MNFVTGWNLFHKRTVLLAGILMLTLSLQAQLPEPKRERRLTKQGDELFQQKKYTKAIEKYKEVLSRYDGNPDVWFNLAVSYQEVGNPDLAQLYYSKILKTNDQANPIVHLALGKVLMMQGKYDEAREQFIAYNEILEYNDQMAMRYISSIENIDRYFADSTFFQKESLAINSPAADFGASTADKSFYFLSTRDRKSDLTDLYTSDLFTAPLKDIEGSSTTPVPQKVKGPTNTRFGEVGYAIVPSTNEIYICRFHPNEQDQYSLGYSLYKAYMGYNKDITKPERIVADKFKFAIAYPTLSENGKKIVFSSDAPGGFGGWDLYQADFTSTGFENIQNLGENVNSAGDELYAFLLNDSILFFATDGHGGLGGFDIYSKNLGNTEYARNLGYPVNSSANDYAIYFESGLSGYFTSNSEGGKGSDDIYKFDIHQLKLSSEIVEKGSGDNLKNVNISVTRSKGNDEVLALADNGKLVLVAQPNEVLKITVEKEGYETKTFEVNTAGMSFIGNHSLELGKFEVLKIEKDVPDTYTLEPELTVQAEVKEEIFFATEIKYSRTRLSQAELKKIYSGNLEITEMRDDKYYRYIIGRYDSYFEAKEVFLSEKLEEPVLVAYINGIPAKVMKALKDAHVTPAEAKDPLVHDFIDRTNQLGSSLVFYDLDKFRVPRGSEIKLQAVVDTLKANPDYFLEIAAHTDSRGSDMYNRALSEERARFLREYFLSKGIDELRIISHGIGKSQLKKYCTNCTEEDHALNRRGELIIRIDKNGSKQ